MEKKSLFVIFVFLLISIVLIPNVCAQWDFRAASQQWITWIQDALGPFFEVILGVSQFDEYFFARILFLILIFVVVHAVLGRIRMFRDNTAILIIVSAVVSILGARFIGESEFIIGMLIPYGALTIAISVLLPFVIFFFFVEGTIDNPLWRRVAWIFYGLVLFGIWFTRATDIGELGWIYGIAFLGIILSLLLDRQIRNWFIRAEVRAGGAVGRRGMIGDHQDRIRRIQEQAGRGGYPGGWPQARRDIRQLERAIANIRNMP